MNSEKVSFENRHGAKLSALLELPVSGKPVAFAVFAHCFTCSKSLSTVVNISRALTLHQIAVLRFDFTGLGESEGNFSETNFSSNIDDLLMACKYLNDNHQAPQIIIGHSLGGAAVLAAAGNIASLRAVVTLNAPAEPVHLENLLRESVSEVKAKGEALVDIGGRPFKIKAQLLDDLRNSMIRDDVGNLKQALLIMHSPEDRIVNVENARNLYESARHPKSFISLDGADHLISKREDSQYVGNLIAAWVEKYLDYPQHHPLSTDKQVVCQTGDDGYTTQIQAGDHSFLADEPVSVGGANLGPTPYNLLIASLGACTSMTLRMYADRKKWPLEKVLVHLEHAKVHRKDCEDYQKDNARIDQISRELELFGDLDEDQKKRLLEIANKCPVHKTLHGKIEVNTTLRTQTQTRSTN